MEKTGSKKEGNKHTLSLTDAVGMCDALVRAGVFYCQLPMLRSEYCLTRPELQKIDSIPSFRYLGVSSTFSLKANTH
jgi:hypothetical protein